MAKQDDWLKVTIRMPPALHAELVAATGPNSLNAEVLTRLEQSLRGERIARMRTELEDRFREVDETGVSPPRPEGAPLRYPVDDVPLRDILRQLDELTRTVQRFAEQAKPAKRKKAAKTPVEQ